MHATVEHYKKVESVASPAAAAGANEVRVNSRGKIRNYVTFGLERLQV